MGHVAHTHITDGTLINRIHNIRYDSRINHLTSMFHVRNSYNARYWKSEEEALDLTVRRTRRARRRDLSLSLLLQTAWLFYSNWRWELSMGWPHAARSRLTGELEKLPQCHGAPLRQPTGSCWILVQARGLCPADTQLFTGRYTTSTSDTKHCTWNAARRIAIYIRTNDRISSVFCELSTVFCVQLDMNCIL